MAGFVLPKETAPTLPNCPQCEKTFRKESGLEWHLRHAHSETGGDSQSARASMAQETPEKHKTTFAELQEATQEVIWTSPLGGEIVRAFIALGVLDEKDVPEEVIEQPETPKEPYRVYLIA